MNNLQKWVVIAGLFFVGLLGGLVAQQQFSGGQSVLQSGTWTVQPGNTANTTAWKVDGSAVTQPVSGTVTANEGGTWTVQPGNTANTTAWKVDGSAVTQPVSGTVSLSALPALVAGTAKVGITYPYTGCATTQAETATAVLTGTTTTVFSATSCLIELVVSNTGSASLTYYVTDNAGTPLAVFGSSGNPITILAGERDIYNFPNGMKFTSGLKLTTSAATGAYYALAVQ